MHGKFEAHATLVAGKFLSSQVKTFESVTQKVTEIFRSVGGPRAPTQDSNETGTHGNTEKPYWRPVSTDLLLYPYSALR